MDCSAEKEVDVRPFAYAISLIEGKWKMHILFWLWKAEVLRYSELKRSQMCIRDRLSTGASIFYCFAIKKQLISMAPARGRAA